MNTINVSELRARLVGLSDAKLDQMSRDESLRQVERDVAGDMLRERGQLEQHRQGVARREERRQAARATVDDAQEPETLPAVLGHLGGSQAMTKNQAAAESFAGILQRIGLPAKARRTQKVNGRDVVDGWTVNVRDAEAEVGYVAVWHGRGHFLAYVEINGHRDRTDETAALFAAFQQQLGDDKGKTA
jgi:hypothetical protein